jgi:CRP-like cAMP-binding protein
MAQAFSHKIMTFSPVLPNRFAQQTVSKFARREFLPTRDALWQIETGVVRTQTVLEDGNSITLGLWGAGDVVGKVLCNANPYQIECLTTVEVTLIPAHRWHELTQAMILHIQHSSELIEIMHYRQAEIAVLQLFAWLAKRFGQEVEQGRLIDLRLTHQDIADLIGLTRVTVTRIISNLEKQGMIQRQQRHFIVSQDQPPFWHYEI